MPSGNPLIVRYIIGELATSIVDCWYCDCNSSFGHKRTRSGVPSSNLSHKFSKNVERIPGLKVCVLT